jgi:hypothetical protein
VVADGGKQVISANVFRADAREKVSRVGKPHGSVVGDDVAIDAQCDLTAGIL